MAGVKQEIKNVMDIFDDMVKKIKERSSDYGHWEKINPVFQESGKLMQEELKKIDEKVNKQVGNTNPNSGGGHA